MNLAIPAFASTHRDPVVVQLCHVARRLFEHRWNLGAELLDRRGDRILPPFRELLERLGRRRTDDADAPELEDYHRRRADRMQAVCSVLVTLAGCCDWVTMEVLDPRGGYLSVRRLAELAELPLDPVADPDDDREPGDRTERALRMLRAAKIVAFTKQNREKLPDGRHVSNSPALRKLSVSFFRKVGGALLTFFKRRRKKLKGQRERRREREERAGVGVDLRTRQLRNRLGRGAELGRSPAAPPAPSPARPDRVPQELIDAIAAETGWDDYGAIVREARRRLGFDTS